VPFVVDASVCACWALDDEHHPAADAALAQAQADEIVVPSLWWFEIRNMMLSAERRKRSTVASTNAFLGALRKLRIAIDRDPNELVIFRLARTHRLTVYDAAYLELAMREALPLATLDRALVAAAQAERVPLVQ